MQNRQKDEIVRDILTSANGGATISRIMFRAYVSHGQAKGYLGELIEKDLIECDVFVREYRTTSKGIEYLNATERMSEMLQLDIRRAVSNKSKELQTFVF